MPPQELQPKPGDELKRLRTYQSDVEEIMQRGQVSKASIAIAENEKQIKREDEAEPLPAPLPTPSKVFHISGDIPVLEPRWNLRLLFSLTLGAVVVIGIGVGSFFFFRSMGEPAVLPPKTEVSKTNAVVLQGGERRAGAISAIRKSLQSISVPQNEIRAIPIQLGDVAITTPLFFETIGVLAPPALVRALSIVPVLGLHGFQGGQPFLLFSVSSFDYAFAGMLTWEETLLEDIGPLFGVSPRAVLEQVGSTTAEALTSKIVFKDIIIRNKDARAAFNPQGNIIFLYAFIDKQTLVLTTKEDTLRLLQSKARGGRLK